jgi:hypothetical protein
MKPLNLQTKQGVFVYRGKTLDRKALSELLRGEPDDHMKI